MCPRLKSALLSPKKAEKQDPKRTVFKLHNCIPEHCLLTCIASSEKYAAVLISNHFYVTGLFLWLLFHSGWWDPSPMWSLGMLPADPSWWLFSWRWEISMHSRTDLNSPEDPARGDPLQILEVASCFSALWALVPLPGLPSLCPVPGIFSPDSKLGEP